MTLSSMDGHMEMSRHYTYRADGSIAAVNASSPFSADMKTCPSCRGPLRNLARYGHIVRRALLDESTKKFIVWSNRDMITLCNEFHALEKVLVQTMDDLKSTILAPSDFNLTTVNKAKHLREVALVLLLSKRYGKLFTLRSRIQKFTRDVSEREQPFARVWELCENARRRHQVTAAVDCDNSILQAKCHLNASALSIRCDLTIVSDLAHILRNKIAKSMIKKLQINLDNLREQSQKLLVDAVGAQRSPNETEAHLFMARCAILETAATSALADAPTLHSEAKTHLDAARQICQAHPGATRGLLEEVQSVEDSLRGSFYNAVTPEERMGVLRAMASEFSGTGHWYYCRNGHPFTVGECGGPMQETRCPECDEPVGGQHHRAAEGVTRANDLEDTLRNLVLG